MAESHAKPLTKCGNCRYGGTHFKLGQTTHLHCEHPDEKIAGEVGWGTLREWYSTCSEWKAKQTVSIDHQAAKRCEQREE